MAVAPWDRSTQYYNSYSTKQRTPVTDTTTTTTTTFVALGDPFPGLIREYIIPEIVITLTLSLTNARVYQRRYFGTRKRVPNGHERCSTCSSSSLGCCYQICFFISEPIVVKLGIGLQIGDIVSTIALQRIFELRLN